MYTTQDTEYWSNYAPLIQGRYYDPVDWYSPKVVANYRGFEVVFNNYYHSAVSGRYAYSGFSQCLFVDFVMEKKFAFTLKEKSSLQKFISQFTKSNFNQSLELSMYFIKTNNAVLFNNIFENNHIPLLLPVIKNGEIAIHQNHGVFGAPLNAYNFELSYNRPGKFIPYTELLQLTDLIYKIIDGLMLQDIIKPVHIK